MSTIVPLLAGLALVVAALVPLGLAFWKPAARLPAALLYALVLSGVAVHHSGLSFANVSPPPAAATATVAETPETEELAERCNEVLGMAEQGSLLRDRSNPSRVVVDRALWNQLPDYVQQGLVRCLEITRGDGDTNGDIEIVEQ